MKEGLCTKIIVIFLTLIAIAVIFIGSGKVSGNDNLSITDGYLDAYNFYSGSGVEFIKLGGETRLVPQIIQNVLVDNETDPYGFFIFCINPGGAFCSPSATKDDMKKGEKKYSQWVDYTDNKDVLNDLKKKYETPLWSMEYEIDEEIDFSGHQDSAYIYSAYTWSNDAPLIRAIPGMAMWTSSLCDGLNRDDIETMPGGYTGVNSEIAGIVDARAKDLARRASAYNNFYKNTHDTTVEGYKVSRTIKVKDPDTQEIKEEEIEEDGYETTFKVEDLTKEENLKVMVDQEKRQYIVGPFKYDFEYQLVDGYYLTEDYLINKGKTDLEWRAQLGSDDPESEAGIQKLIGYFHTYNAPNKLKKLQYCEKVYAMSWFNNLSIGVKNPNDPTKEIILIGDINAKKTDNPIYDREYITDESGERVKALKGVQFVDGNGDLIKAWNLIDFNKGYERIAYWNVIKPKEDFYVRIDADILEKRAKELGVTNLTKINVRVDMAFYDRCYAHAARYTGGKYECRVNFTTYEDSDYKDISTLNKEQNELLEKEEEKYSTFQFDSQSKGLRQQVGAEPPPLPPVTPGSGPGPGTGPTPNPGPDPTPEPDPEPEPDPTYDYAQYTFAKTMTSDAQVLAIFNYAATGKYGYGRIIDSRHNGHEIDISMHLGGKVFIDKPQGKENEGNDTYDSGEELEGIDVTLFDSDHNVIATTLTGPGGTYLFDKLNAMKQYYVRFGYNGMLYTNVAYARTGRGENESKAREGEQGHTRDREELNSTFEEIRAYPNNYKITNKVFGNDLGDYNKIYYQEEIVEVFRAVAEAIVNNGGNELQAYREVARQYGESMVQFVADCRINAYTVTKYPRYRQFLIEKHPVRLMRSIEFDDVEYRSICPEQEYVNLGIKNRPTFDLATYKDAYNAVIKINGKQETYTYNSRMEPGNFGMKLEAEKSYFDKMEDAYKNGNNKSIDDKTQRIDAGSYTHEIRGEEIVNGNNNNEAIKNKQNNQLFAENKNYAWREIQSGLSNGEKLDIKITYKIAVRNQSGVEGAVTEIVDYYDPNYDFDSVYLGDQNANKVGNVSHSDRSKYTNSEKSITGYQRIYFRPDETKLNTANREMYIYATFSLKDPENTLIRAGLLNGKNLETMNIVEINGYTTYDMGLIDMDSIPGNLETPSRQGEFEDDESTAPSYIFTLRHSRTMEGTVFEDAITSFNDNGKVQTATSRYGNGKLDNKDTKIKDMIVELIEIKDNKMIVRAITRTDANGWYGFGAFIPGEYVVRFTYGAEDTTALTTTTRPDRKGSNAISYNGQDYESTKYSTKEGQGTTNSLYSVDSRLQGRYDQNNREKNAQEQSLVVGNQEITKYISDQYYWYSDKDIQDTSKAKDDEARKRQVIEYSKGEYGREITNHKAEVFNAYSKEQPEHIKNDQVLHNALIQELERRTYRYAYTAQMPIEVEYTKRTVKGSQPSSQYTYKMEGVNFGIVQRPKAKLEVEKHVSHIRITTADDKVLFESNRQIPNLLSWPVKTNRYRRVPTIQAIMDQELISGAKLEVTYTIKVTNNSEEGIGPTRAKNIIDYVPNNLTFNKEDNPGWEVVNQENIQTDRNSTYINNTQNGAYKLIDLSTKQTIIKTTQDNPATWNLNPGESRTTNLVLRKVLSAESPTDDLTYRNMVEIIEIDNEKGRYDHSSTPGNQKPDEEPTEDDSYESEIITVLPPFGSRIIYYGLGIIIISLLAVGIYFIKKKVLGKGNR